jgi:hypothetical protein
MRSTVVDPRIWSVLDLYRLGYGFRRVRVRVEQFLPGPMPVPIPTHSSKSGIEVTKFGFSSNARSLRSPSDPLPRTYHPSDHGATPTERPHHPNSFSTSLHPHTSVASRAMAHEKGTDQPIAGILGLVSSSHTQEVANTRTQALSNPVSTHPYHSKPTQMCPTCLPTNN